MSERPPSFLEFAFGVTPADMQRFWEEAAQREKNDRWLRRVNPTLYRKIYKKRIKEGTFFIKPKGLKMLEQTIKDIRIVSITMKEYNALDRSE